MLQKIYYFTFIVFILLWQSCGSVPTNSYYISDESNMLKLAEKDDIKISASTNTLSSTNDRNGTGKSFNIQGGYSPIKHLGIYANHAQWSRSTQSFFTILPTPTTDTRWGSDHRFNSLAVGGYYLYQSENQKARMTKYNTLPIGILFDLYSGFGRGKVNNYFWEGDNSVLKFNKPYAQLGIHWQDEYVGVSWVYRFGQLYFNEGTYNVNGSNRPDAGVVFQQISDQQKFNFRESSLKVFVGLKEARMYLAYTSTFVKPTNFSFTLPFGDNMVHAGIVINIEDTYQTLFKKNKK